VSCGHGEASWDDRSYFVLKKKEKKDQTKKECKKVKKGSLERSEGVC
tara:strand:- start:169 stop:309 length:141 start_codon:yes stop_codon:yes gene_type:complete